MNPREWPAGMTQERADRYVETVLPDGEPAEETPRAFDLTDVGNAKRLVHRHGRDLLWVPGIGWHVWNGACYEVDELERVQGMAKAVAVAIGAEEAAACPDDARRAALWKWAARSQSDGRLGAMVHLARDEVNIAHRARELDANPWALTVANGTIDLRTGSLRAHRRSDLITKRTPIAFDTAAECPRWERFIARIMGENEEMITFLRRAIGYSLTGDTSEDCFFFLVGAGWNGKSSLLGTLHKMLGDHARTTAFDTFLVRTTTGGPSGDVARLAGARFVSAIEPPAGRRWDESRLKGFTGGDPQQTSFKHRDEFEFLPQCKLWFAANRKPPLLDSSEGMRRRLRLIPFTVATREDDAEYDKHLDDRLAGELPGILAWAVRGCLEWQRHECLGEPADVREASSEYIAEADPLGQFMQERCEYHAAASVSASELFAQFEAWRCGQDAIAAMTATAFGRAVSDRGVAKKKVSGTIRYLGLKIRGVGDDQGELGGFETVLRFSPTIDLHKEKPENLPKPSEPSREALTRPTNGKGAPVPFRSLYEADERDGLGSGL